MMTADGLAKLLEECGELTQIAAKKLAYFNTDEHPDGKGSMRERLQEEIADVAAASAFVTENFGLDAAAITTRTAHKLALFRKWHADPTNSPDSASVNRDLKPGPNFLHLLHGGMICGWCAAAVDPNRPRACCARAREWDAGSTYAV